MLLETTSQFIYTIFQFADAYAKYLARKTFTFTFLSLEIFKFNVLPLNKHVAFKIQVAFKVLYSSQDFRNSAKTLISIADYLAYSM